MSHSPGPWKVEGEEDSVSYPAVVAADDTEVCLGFGDTDRPTRYANARLIAAAPDLLAACQQGLSALEWCHQWLGGEDAAELQKAIDALKKAIQLTKGRGGKS